MSGKRNSQSRQSPPLDKHLIFMFLAVGLLVDLGLQVIVGFWDGPGAWRWLGVGISLIFFAAAGFFGVLAFREYRSKAAQSKRDRQNEKTPSDEDPGETRKEKVETLQFEYDCEKEHTKQGPRSGPKFKIESKT